MAGADVVLQRRRLGHARRERRRLRSPRAPGSSSSAASSSARGRPRTARSAPSSRSSPTSSARACAGRRPRSSAPTARAATADSPAAVAAAAAAGAGAAGSARPRPDLRRRRAVLSTSDRSEGRAKLMASKKNRARAVARTPNPRKYKKKTSPLVTEKVEYVDYKDVDLLTRFMSDRAKIRNRRVSGNDVQQQREIANAIKIAREMALLPYAKRVLDAAHAPAARRRPPPAPRRRGSDEPGPEARRAVDAVDDVEVDDERRRRRRRTARRPEHAAHPAQPISTGSASAATSSTSPTATAATTCCRKGLALNATAGAVDQAAKMRRARDLRDASDREAARPIATHAGAEGDHHHGQGRQRGQAVRLGHRRRRRRRRPASRPASSSTASAHVDEPIKSLGQHTVTAKLHSDVSFPITRRGRPA